MLLGGLAAVACGAPDPPRGTPGQKKVIYSLNPFDGGGSRDLSRPVDTETGKAVEDEDENEEGKP